MSFETSNSEIKTAALWTGTSLLSPLFHQPVILSRTQKMRGKKTPNTTNHIWVFLHFDLTKVHQGTFVIHFPLSFLSLFPCVIPLQPGSSKLFCSNHWLKLKSLRIFSIDALSQAAHNSFHTPQQEANKTIQNSS